ncbi:MAG: pyridoxal-phosphate dependent enzyme [Gammaproteobacteria bacterium]|nr:pyridoxal-phosphate dependent enzyme [Gammaproteobacteria bacterium]
MLDGRAGAQVFCKAENLQKVGAFKFRGAANAVFSLPDDAAARGVATHSSGNHGAAVALAARLRGIPAYVVMPHDAPAAKRAAVAHYGADIRACRPGLGSRERALDDLIAATGAQVIHPYNDHRVIAGQGTAALELLEECAGLDALLVPVGGGGLLSGTAIAGKGLVPGIRIIGVEPRQADDAWQSLTTGRRVIVDSPDTVADGLRASLGELTFAIIRRHVDEIVRVEEAAIVAAMRFVWERMKLVIEPSAAVPVAALLEGAAGVAGLRVGVILSGGNVDLQAALALMAT